MPNESHHHPPNQERYIPSRSIVQTHQVSSKNCEFISSFSLPIPHPHPHHPSSPASAPRNYHGHRVGSTKQK
ncbi:hypothetical protein BDW02DRAFT_143273 [Decorospora gaudefroyi]|uniref:Uncharacterized protein n=1 Tax=Decorospora gaudefroyi TaxID=184978 RepID=A0A6A5K547_9PLEO|nr:hypothetical protein BDW02DRAFT_143273 [Decorospora gaudefroyi]